MRYLLNAHVKLLTDTQVLFQCNAKDKDDERSK